MVDDYIPIGIDGHPCFSQALGNEMWVFLLEKAWSKLHGSYERIISGSPSQTYRDVTGAPSYEHKTNQPGIFDKLL